MSSGADRFGRIVDQKWVFDGSATTADEFECGYNYDSNRLYRKNDKAAAFSELYHANNDVYDGLDRLKEWRRGTLFTVAQIL